MKKNKKLNVKNKIKKTNVSIPINEHEKPGWNNDINNLEKYKLSSGDLVK